MTSPASASESNRTRKQNPTFFRKKQTRGSRKGTRQIGSRIVPRVRATGRVTGLRLNREDEPSGSQRWLVMTDDNGEDGEYEDLVLEVVPETNDFIGAIIEPLNFVSIMGPTRSGKSTLMNLLAECKITELFPTSGGPIPFTKGIDLGNKIMSVEEFSRADGGQEVSPIVPGQQIGFLDTEGQGDQGDGYDISLFTPAILCSRIVIFNTKEVAKDSLLTQLALMTTIAQRIQLEEEEDPENPGPKFGHLMITINQYTLGGSVEDLVQNILAQEPGSSSAVKRRNEIRTMLYAQFEDISLHILRGNTLKEGVEEDLESGVKKFLLLEDFIPSYVEEFLVLRSVFAEKLRHPRIVAEESLSGQSAAGLVPSIVAAINAEDPLDIPDLWEQTQNAAIAKASLTFRTAFREACDAVLQSSDLYPTVQVTRLLEEEIENLLFNMERTLSYIPQAKIIATRAILSEEALIGTQNTLALNLTRIQSFAQLKLVALIAALPEHLINEFPTLLVSRPTAMTRIEQLKERLFSAYKAEIIGYDPNGFPQGYHGIFDTAYQGQLTIMLETITLGWVQWVVTKDEDTLRVVRAALAKLSDDTPVGDLAKWKKAAEDIRLDTTQGYNGVIDATYLWTGPAEVKAGFLAKLTEVMTLAEEGYMRDEEAIRRLIDTALATQIQAYKNFLLTALPPRKEPGDYATIINTSVYRIALLTLMTSSNVSETLINEYLLSFDTQTAALINAFSAEYTKASNDFIKYLEDQLAVLVPHRLGDFKLLADVLLIHKDLAKTALRSMLDSHGDSVLSVFDSEMLAFEITQAAGTIRVEAARRSLFEGIELHRGMKFSLLKDAVGEWNKEKLNKDTEPVLAGVVDYSIDTIAKLRTAVDKGKVDFWSHACGDEADKVEGWGVFEKQVTSLEENVRRASALFIGKVNATEGSTSEMEKIVMSKIINNVANATNLLGMSWINSAREFLVETTNGDGGKDGRSHLYKNVPKQDQGEQWDKPTCLRFHKWRVEFSDFRFDDPIIQELTPFVINQFEPPIPDVDTAVDVTLTQAEKETITNTNSTMFKFDMEYSHTAGIKDVASSTVKVAFGGSSTFTDAKANEISFSIAFKTPVVCPANRRTIITHLGFKQKMSMTYTAKVKIVPEVQFTRGFTIWGGGPYWDPSNERPNYHKQHTGNRFYGDIDNGYTDELKAKAAADSDPWAWRACIGRHSSVQSYINSLNTSPQYELYVRGRWEGINGWNHVIRRNISIPETKAATV